MLATLNPMHNDFKPPQDYSSHKFSQSRYSPPESPRHLPSFFNAQESTMSNTHRGLPPPLGMSIQNSEQRPAVVATLGNLPAPPSQWSGHDDSMRNWLQAKAEEDRRKQEEERTKQETLRVEQRKIEAEMLKDSLQGGIPPPMVPLIFAGMGGAALSGQALEWAQQYFAQLSLESQRHLQIEAQQQHHLHQHQTQQPGPPSPDIRRDARMIPPNPYAAPPPPQYSTQPPGPPSSSGQNRSFNQAPQSANTLSRLNTSELHPQSSSAPSSRHSMNPLQQTQPGQGEASSGPGLFFHHWTPPTNSNTGSGQPPTPSTKSQQGSPFDRPPHSHLRSDYQNSPKKRKVAGGNGAHHHGVAAPSSQRSDPSPPPHHRDHSPDSKSKPQHSRENSDASSHETRDRPIARPSSRQRRQDELSSGRYYSARPYTDPSVNGVREDHPMR